MITYFADRMTNVLGFASTKRSSKYMIVDDGITPARAGTTLAPFSPSIFDQDHPRSRGNYHRHTQPLSFQGGSPPLARELHLNTKITSKDIRIAQVTFLPSRRQKLAQRIKPSIHMRRMQD